MATNSKVYIAVAILVGGIGGSLATANLIEVLKPYAMIITAGGTFISAVVAYFINKANGAKDGTAK